MPCDSTPGFRRHSSEIAWPTPEELTPELIQFTSLSFARMMGEVSVVVENDGGEKASPLRTPRCGTESLATVTWSDHHGIMAALSLNIKSRCGVNRLDLHYVDMEQLGRDCDIEMRSHLTIPCSLRSRLSYLRHLE